MKKITFNLELDSVGTAELKDFPELGKYGLYLIKYRNQVIRIGECSSGNARLKKGFREAFRKIIRGKERKNYMAYHWRSNYSGKKVIVDYFELVNKRFKDDKFRRALEAELTFQFRVSKKKWPKVMSEIHFLEEYRNNKTVTSTATEILQSYGLKYDSKV